MIRKIDAWLQSKSQALIMMVSIVTLSIIGAVDYLTGVEVNLTLFYLIPVILVTWGIGTGAGIIASVFAALVWAIIDHFGRPELHLAAALWNIGIELALFLFFAVSAARLRDDTREQDRLNGELQAALAEVRTLSGILPICAWCKRIRDENGNWQRLESYLKSHSEAEFTHGICPECAQQQFSKMRPPES